MPGTEISDKTIHRLSVYLRILKRLASSNGKYVFSHELAALSGFNAAQVRRDVMVIGSEGKPKRGYQVALLADRIERFLDSPEGMAVALVGIGNAGRAIISFFPSQSSRLSIAAAFDTDPYKVNRVINGCRCWPVTDLGRVVSDKSILIAIVAVPAKEAQAVTDKLVAAGVRGLLNFAPVTLRVPPHVYVEDLDITVSLQKVAYFARQSIKEL
ncbi:MAG: redox-sensing transcriptional repressor Rex [Phycisphaerae bacterium]|nr:redox-sensing transcriptional repressor Rex [Phycisphaerae bacterium]